jgi:hypothetical protein
MSTATVVIEGPCALLSANRSLHWSKRSVIVRDWRLAARHDAKGTPAFERAKITVEIMQKAAVLADAGNYYPTVKACVDGLVDAGVLPNDTPSHVLGVELRPPTKAPKGSRRDLVILTLDGDLRLPPLAPVATPERL